MSDELRKLLAEGATKGTWFEQDSLEAMFIDLQLKHYTGDAAFIEAASPDVVLGILDRIAEQEADSKALGELLAVIHRDGGQYQEEKGTTKAVEDAHAVWAGLVVERDQWKQDAEQNMLDYQEIYRDLLDTREAVRRLAGALELLESNVFEDGAPDEALEIAQAALSDPVVRRIVEGG